MSDAIFLDDGLPYPLVLFRTRYGGTYEGGEWAALTDERIPEDSIGSDPDCADFWGQVWAHNGVLADPRPVAYGVGATPGDAIADCTANARAYNWSLIGKEPR